MEIETRTYGMFCALRREETSMTSDSTLEGSSSRTARLRPFPGASGECSELDFIRRVGCGHLPTFTV